MDLSIDHKHRVSVYACVLRKKMHISGSVCSRGFAVGPAIIYSGIAFGASKAIKKLCKHVYDIGANVYMILVQMKYLTQ